MEFKVTIVCLLVAVQPPPFFTAEYIEVPNNKVDLGFGRIDSNTDGSISPNEFNRVIYRDDKNGDGCVSRDEYEDGAEAPHALSDLMFGYFDSDNNNCLTSRTMAREFTLADADGNGLISVQEWEMYFQHLMKQLFNTVTNSAQTAIVG